MHRYLNACAENVSEKTLRLARGNLRGRKANHLDRGLKAVVCSTFQSSPAPEDGRCELAWARLAWQEQFQSSPAPEDGRCMASRQILRDMVLQFQSSPAPEDGRCGRIAGKLGTGHGCFNPRPPQRTGAALSAHAEDRSF